MDRGWERLCVLIMISVPWHRVQELPGSRVLWCLHPRTLPSPPCLAPRPPAFVRSWDALYRINDWPLNTDSDACLRTTVMVPGLSHPRLLVDRGVDLPLYVSCLTPAESPLMESGCSIRCYAYCIPLSGGLVFMTCIHTYVYTMNDCIAIAFRCNFVSWCSRVHYRLGCVCVCCDLCMMLMCIVCACARVCS